MKEKDRFPWGDTEQSKNHEVLAKMSPAERKAYEEGQKLPIGFNPAMR